jgi:hypothetical protein
LVAEEKWLIADILAQGGEHLGGPTAGTLDLRPNRAGFAWSNGTDYSTAE